MLQPTWLSSDLTNDLSALAFEPEFRVTSDQSLSSILWIGPGTANSTSTSSTTGRTAGSVGSSVSAQSFTNAEGAGASVTITTTGENGPRQSTVQDFVPGATSSLAQGAVSTTAGGASTLVNVSIAPGSTSVTSSDSFDPASYLAANLDLIQVFGDDLIAATQHFQTYGQSEGRSTTFDADDYLASHGDLIQVFGYDLAAATQHYIQWGASEGRAVDSFDEVAYLNAHSDLQNAFGQNYGLATQHYITYGYAEGRIF